MVPDIAPVIAVVPDIAPAVAVVPDIAPVVPEVGAVVPELEPLVSPVPAPSICGGFAEPVEQPATANHSQAAVEVRTLNLQVIALSSSWVPAGKTVTCLRAVQCAPRIATPEDCDMPRKEW
jgi:hypothetical protein